MAKWIKNEGQEFDPAHYWVRSEGHSTLEYLVGAVPRSETHLLRIEEPAPPEEEAPEYLYVVAAGNLCPFFYTTEAEALLQASPRWIRKIKLEKE